MQDPQQSMHLATQTQLAIAANSGARMRSKVGNVGIERKFYRNANVSIEIMCRFAQNEILALLYSLAENPAVCRVLALRRLFGLGSVDSSAMRSRPRAVLGPSL